MATSQDDSDSDGSAAAADMKICDIQLNSSSSSQFSGEEDPAPKMPPPESNDPFSFISCFVKKDVPSSKTKQPARSIATESQLMQMYEFREDVGIEPLVMEPNPEGVKMIAILEEQQKTLVQEYALREKEAIQRQKEAATEMLKEFTTQREQTLAQTRSRERELNAVKTEQLKLAAENATGPKAPAMFASAMNPSQLTQHTRTPPQDNEQSLQPPQAALSPTSTPSGSAASAVVSDIIISSTAASLAAAHLNSDHSSESRQQPLPRTWGTDDVVLWLRGLGCGQYEDAFRESAVDGTVLFDIADEEILEHTLGVKNKIHRIKIRKAIAALAE
eukprot:Rmarinus@m.6480